MAPAGGVGLPFKRRWLNHRKSVTGHAEQIPSAVVDTSTTEGRGRAILSPARAPRGLTSRAGLCLFFRFSGAGILRERDGARGGGLFGVARLEDAVEHLGA